jgi:hypothetical protein
MSYAEDRMGRAILVVYIAAAAIVGSIVGGLLLIIF